MDEIMLEYSCGRFKVPTAAHNETNTINPLAGLSGQNMALTLDRLVALHGDTESQVKAWDTGVDHLATYGPLLDKDHAAVLARGRVTAEELWGAGS
jgi:hypothetical protein